MGVKVDSSFLRFLTMGASCARAVIQQLRLAGFQPVELERYSCSNKIWATKVKRLRLPDLLCVKTGMRVEVRAKSKLKIRMSDAPDNPQRRWDASLRDDDLVAFMACGGTESEVEPLGEACFFSVGALRSTVSDSKLGPAKSASEGSERDREWPAIVPSQDGVVEAIVEAAQESAGKVVVWMDGGSGRHRRQTFSLKGKQAYVRPGDRFRGRASILGGLPSATARLDDYANCSYDPVADLTSSSEIDRYAAVKALSRRANAGDAIVSRLERLIHREQDWRVALEAAGGAAAMGSPLGEDYISELLAGDGPIACRMEAILLLSEISTPIALGNLRRIAADKRLAGSELRQAAIWGMGRSGHRSYGDLVPYIGDDDEAIALHAMAAFGGDTPQGVIDDLVGKLHTDTPRFASAASEVLRLIGGEGVVTAVLQRALAETECEDWVVATLGRLDGEIVRRQLEGNPFLDRLGPLLILFGDNNWVKSREPALNFLMRQNL